MSRAQKRPVKLAHPLLVAAANGDTPPGLTPEELFRVGPVRTQIQFERMAAITERRYRIGEDNRQIKTIGETIIIGMIFVLVILAGTRPALALTFFAGIVGGGFVMALVNYWAESLPFTMDDLP